MDKELKWKGGQVGEDIQKFERLAELMQSYGKEVVLALAILVAGLLLIRVVVKYFRRLLGRFVAKPALVATVGNVIHVVLVVLLLASVLQYAGMEALVIRRILIAASLAAVAIIIVFRPYIPSLPFKVGNTIKTGDLLGKVEATTLISTRIRTFDGKTVFVPDSKILNDYLINYHFTPERQIRLVFGITYRSDLLKAKKIVAEILAEDPRVLGIPAARVFVLNLAESCVEIAARPWVRNVDYWRTRCDLIEKVKLRFDQEGITIAFPQHDVHLYYESREPAPENS